MNACFAFALVLIFSLVFLSKVNKVKAAISSEDKSALKDEVVEMFDHAFNSYMTYAYPADELMPISCKGRFRGNEPSRGDIDDALGQFSLTLIDSLDTLVILNKLDLFEESVYTVIKDVKFDNDVVVSVFETNIRVLGGLLGGHVMAEVLKERGSHLSDYAGQLLHMAREVGYRLLPAFNTSTGVPYPRVNLRYGLTKDLKQERDTCTACAGTMILEFAALSRLTGDPVFEDKAHRCMEYLWNQRHRSSDLMGAIINIHNGDWIRRTSGVGAGIDSYYEYCLKGYILLGYDTYRDRFNKHYSAIMKYVSQGPMLVDVHMHRPHSASRNFMDALLAFWPGLQVLKGDIKPAIETHEMLYQITKRHNFLPEAFTTDFRVHWPHSPLRPEFVESTYFLYKATRDPYYLQVGADVVSSLNKFARTSCGFASVKDVRTGAQADQMDSYVLAELFKYLYLLFSEDEDVPIRVEDYLFTTEAHLLPLNLSRIQRKVSSDVAGGVPSTVTLSDMQPVSLVDGADGGEGEAAEDHHDYRCPNINHMYPANNKDLASLWRQPLTNLVMEICPKPKVVRRSLLRARDFVAGNEDHANLLARMGVRVVTLEDGRVQLLHASSTALTPDDAEEGLQFMQDMIDFTKQQEQRKAEEVLRFVQAGDHVWQAGRAQFGPDLASLPQGEVTGEAVVADPYRGCEGMNNGEELRGKVGVVERGNCMFIDKARQLQAHGAIGGIVIDSVEDTSGEKMPMFAMSGDGSKDITIPMLFLYSVEGKQLLAEINLFYQQQKPLVVRLGKEIRPMAGEAVREMERLADEVGDQQYPVTVSEIKEKDGVLYVDVEKIQALSPTVNMMREAQLIGYHSPSGFGDVDVKLDGEEKDMFVRYSTTADKLRDVITLKVQEVSELKRQLPLSLTQTTSPTLLHQKVVSEVSVSGEVRGEVSLERGGGDQVSITLTLPPSAEYVEHGRAKLEDIKADLLSHVLTQLTSHTNFNSLSDNFVYVVALRQLTNVLLGKDEMLEYSFLTQLHALTEELTVAGGDIPVPGSGQALDDIYTYTPSELAALGKIHSQNGGAGGQNGDTGSQNDDTRGQNGDTGSQNGGAGGQNDDTGGQHGAHSVDIDQTDQEKYNERGDDVETEEQREIIEAVRTHMKQDVRDVKEDVQEGVQVGVGRRVREERRGVGRVEPVPIEMRRGVGRVEPVPIETVFSREELERNEKEQKERGEL